MTNSRRALGGAIVYALVFSSLVALTGLAIIATQARSSRNAGHLTSRALERATAEAAAEHGKALVQQAIGAQLPLEQLADLNISNDQLNGLEYDLDLSLAAYGDVRADLVGINEWAAARLDPLTGEPQRHLTSNHNIEALALQGEWRDALVHQPPSGDPITIGIHQDGVFTKPSLDTSMPVIVAFPNLNAPPAQLAARGSAGGARIEVGMLLDATGHVWEWPLDQSARPNRLEELAGVTTLTAGDRFALALTESGALHGWGYNPRGPIRPTNSGMGETLHEPTRLTMPQRDGASPALLGVAAGDAHAVALDTHGRVWTWGANDAQQLGRACGAACPADTITLDTGARIISVAAGGDRSAALDQNGRLYTWGAGQPPRLLTHPDGAPVPVTHYSLSTSEGLVVTQDAQLLAYTASTATPLELRVITNLEDGRATTVTRADLLRAGETHHAAIVGSALLTWPADAPGAAVTAQRQLAPGDRPPLSQDDLESVRVTPGDSSLTLTWTPVEGEDLTYEIHHARDARTWQAAGQTTSSSYHLDGLTNGQPYYLRITATDAYGQARREHVSGPHTPAGPPHAPTNGRVTPFHEGLELAWDAPSNNGNPITHYRVEQSTNGLVWQTLPHEPIEPLMRVTGLENGRAYQHRVTAINNAGSSPTHTLPTGTPQGPPATPQLERADGHTLNGQAAITLHWRPASGATTYRVNHSLNGETWNATTAGDATSHTITGLQAGATYRVHLIALNQHGQSRQSREISVTTTAAPSSPRDLTGAPRSDTEALLAWTPPASGAPITAYRLERRDQTTGAWSVIANPTGETHIDTGLEPGRVYAYRVAATNHAGVGAYAPAIELVTALTPPGQPGAPQLLHRNLDSLTITWDAPQHTGGAATLTYRVERRDADHLTWTTLADRHESRTITDATPQPGRAYAYRVTAANPMHAGVPSAETTIAAAEALTAPAKPRVTSRQHLSIAIDWDSSPTPGVTAYVIERAEQDGLFTLHATTPANSGGVQTHTDSRVTAGTTYAYRVRAQTSSDTSDPSPASDQVTALARSAAPQALTATLDPQAGTFQLQWDAPTDTGGSQILGYRIQRNTNEQGWVTITDTQSPATSHVDASAELGQQHSHRVAAITALGVNLHSPYSLATPTQQLIKTPSTPDAPSASTAPGSATIPLVTWLAPNDGGTPITHYDLERDNGGGWTPHATLPAHQTQHADETAQPGGAYRYRVTAHNAAGASQPSNPSDTYQAHPTIPAPPAPHAQPAGVARLAVTWAAPDAIKPADVQGYRLERRAGNSAWSVIVPHTGPNITTHLDTGLSVGVTYQYRVAAINQAGVTGATSTASAAVAAADVPTAPTALTATPSGELSIAIAWGAPASDGHAALTGYKLQARTSQDDVTWGGWSTIYQGEDRAYTHAELIGALSYQYRATASNAAGESAPSGVSAAATPSLRVAN